jgi:hypothetical protein
MHLLAIGPGYHDQPLREMIEDRHVDLVLVCGGHVSHDDMIAMEAHHIPVLSVRGSPSDRHISLYGHPLHDRPYMHGPISVIGIDGIPGIDGYRITQPRACGMMDMWPRCDIIVSYNAPWGIADTIESAVGFFGDHDEGLKLQEQAWTEVLASRHYHGLHHDAIGWIGLRQYIMRQQPDIVIHAHTYPETNRRQRIFRNTRIYYCHGPTWIDTQATISHMTAHPGRVATRVSTMTFDAPKKFTSRLRRLLGIQDPGSRNMA